jgi:hypothetical protein
MILRIISNGHIYFLHTDKMYIMMNENKINLLVLKLC